MFITRVVKMRLLVLAVIVAVSSANLAPLFKHKETIKGEYIVVLKDDVNLEDAVNAIGKDAKIQIQRSYRQVLNGFHARIAEEGVLSKVRERSDVSYVEENGVVRSLETAVTWNQDRVDERNLPLDSYATYKGTGEGVNAYIIDTGIYPSNTYFAGRASVLYDAFYETGIDCNGHGTHCSGIIGSYEYGIARMATLYGVRVLDCQGYGSVDTVLSGMDYVGLYHRKPAVASMSLGGGASTTLDTAVRALVNKGISVAVAAGNENEPACWSSPARELTAITVGATDVEDYRASFSNYGSCVDIFAPGVDILSTWYDSPYATYRLDGTSMACPHVAGAAAVLLGNNRDLTPRQVMQILVDGATSNVITDVGSGSPNKLLYIGTSLDTTPPDQGNSLRPFNLVLVTLTFLVVVLIE